MCELALAEFPHFYEADFPADTCDVWERAESLEGQNERMRPEVVIVWGRRRGRRRLRVGVPGPAVVIGMSGGSGAAGG